MWKSMWLRIAVLRHMEADRDRRRVAAADLEVDVAHRRIERARAGVGGCCRSAGRCRRRKRHAATARGVGAAPGRPRENITMRPMPFWNPGVSSASTKTGRVVP